MKNIFRMYKILAVSLMAAGVFSPSPSGAMFGVKQTKLEQHRAEFLNPLQVLRRPGTRVMRLEDTFPPSWSQDKRTTAALLLGKEKLTAMDMKRAKSVGSGEASKAHECAQSAQAEEKEEGQSFGFSFPTTAPWSLLSAEYIAKESAATGQPVLVGDWGAGCGYFSRLALMVGGMPNALEQIKEFAVKANHEILRSAKPFLPAGRALKDSYTVTLGSVVRTPESFMRRQNDLNVVFNVLHYLDPTEVKACVENIFRNMTPGGVAIFVVETPFTSTGRNSIELDYYKANKLEGHECPGFGVYTRSTISLVSGGSLLMPRSVYRPSPKDIEEKKFPMGQSFPGHCVDPQKYGEDDGGVVLQINPHLKADNPINVLGMKGVPYAYTTAHEAYNFMDYEELSKLVSGRGFKVINGFYTDFNIPTLYSIKEGLDKKVALGEYLRSRVVVIGQRPPEDPA